MKRAILLILIYFGFQLVFMIPVFVVSAVNTLNNGGVVETSMTLIGISTILSSIAMSWFLINQKYVKVTRPDFSMPSLKLLPLLVLLTLGLAVFFDWLTNLLALPDLMKDAFQGMSENVFGVLGICLIAPILEELLFRGAIQGHMLKIYKNPTTSILLSALVFGVIHGNPAQIPFAFLMGIVLGALYYRTGSLIPGIFIHVLNNSLSTVLTNIYPDSNSLFDLVDKNTGYIMLTVSVIVICLCWYAVVKMFPKKEIAGDSEYVKQ